MNPHPGSRVAVAARPLSPVLLAFLVLALATALGLLLVPAAEAKKVKVPVAELPKEPAAAESLAYSVDELPYRVAPGDILDVDFGVMLDNSPLRATAVLVRPDGMITLNPIGDVRAAGLTTVELDSALTTAYRSVYREPHVTIAVARLAGNFVHVLGEVRLPGSYEVLPNSTVLQAIARAGGATDGAAMGNVILMRRTGPNSMVARRIQANHAITYAQASEDPFLRRFDIVYVPKTTIAKIDVFVQQHIAQLLVVPQGYIYGWQAFHIDRIFPKDVRVIP
jgi:protein involved in polysaccharide export with SLBB domain